MRKSIVCLAACAMLAFESLSMAANLESARQLYDSKDYRAAALEYRNLITFNWPKAKLGEIYDIYTECLVVSGQYDLAESRINEFLKILPGDPVASTLTARKTQIAQLRSSEPDVSGVSFSSAKASLDSKNYAQAAAQYAVLLSQNPGANTAEVYDGLTESLMITGKYETASEKIAAFLTAAPSDPLCEKMLARKVRIACETSEFSVATRAGKEYVTKYGSQSAAGQQVLGLLTTAQSKAGRYAEQVAYIDQILYANPDHAMYAELRRRQGDTLSNPMKQVEQGRVKYAEALQRADKESETYEHCAYRLSEIALAAAKTDPAKAAELTAQSDQYLNEFLTHPGSDKIYPANAKRRITALRKLKKYDEMEKEAARYMSDDNVVQYNEIVALRVSLGELIDYKSPYDPAMASSEQTAIHDIKAAYYGGDYAGAIKKAQDFLGSHQDGAESVQAQSLLIESWFRSKKGQELVAYVDQALAAQPEHPKYAEFRKVQADALFNMLKQPAEARTKYVDAMAHSSNDSDVYEWCCYRAGDTFYAQAKAQRDVSLQAVEEFKAQGRPYMQQYLDLPSKDRIYPANVKRRMLAYNHVGQDDLMELEAARYLTEKGDYAKSMYLQIMGILSYNKSMRGKPDPAGALSAFDELRLRENEMSDNQVKLNVGVTMMKSAAVFETQGVPRERVAQLRASARKFLLDASQDESLKATKRLDAYYYLGDWATLKETALKHLEKTDAADAETRVEFMNWIGIALAYQNDKDGALAYFDQALAEYDKNPQAVGIKSVVAEYWALHVSVARQDETRARQYMVRLPNLPNCYMKTDIQNRYGYLLNQN